MPFLNRGQFVFALILLACAIASAQAPPEQKVCAVLAQDDVQPPGLLQLVELNVGQLAAVSLVERQEVEKLLREQQLTALGAGSVRDRIALGRMLRADVLVLLRVRQEPVEGIEVVVAETSQGLRLLHRMVPLEGGLEAAADAVTKLTGDGLAKAREKERQVYA